MPDKEIKERVEIQVKREERKEEPREYLKCTCSVGYRDTQCKKHHSIP